MPKPIIYKLLPDGGFLCGDRTTGLTSYAYPTSEYAVRARKRPLPAARAMLDAERPIYRRCPLVQQRDASHWATLGG